jgi:poly [ADP-ribose] polymerase 2/3/4
MKGNKNNNKFYIIQLVTNADQTTFATYARWGRVGEDGVTSTLIKDTSMEKAFTPFKKKFRDKTGYPWELRGTIADNTESRRDDKYVFLPRDYSEPGVQNAKTEIGRGTPNAETKVPPSNLPLAVQQFVELIFDQKHMSDIMYEMHYDKNRTPLGQLSDATLQHGYSTLKASLLRLGCEYKC